jgi:hypothetical protein
VKLHVICDNYATHKHDNIGRWLAKNPRITLHFTPTSCSWLNMVEIFFGIITRQAIRRGTFADVADLETAIRNYIDAYNDRARPFTWTKTADELLSTKSNVNQSTTRNTRSSWVSMKVAKFVLSSASPVGSSPNSVTMRRESRVSISRSCASPRRSIASQNRR